MLTKREEQILTIIEEQPEITQAQLAARCGITRSSVAVHVSNLMKKGVIVGRGYIVHNKPYILVVGGQNIDICGLPEVEPSSHESTPGHVRISEGGMGRNIAANLALLGEEVKLLTVFGSDNMAERLAASARRLGIDTTQSLTVSAATSTYLLITTTEGEASLSIADTDLFDSMTPKALAARQKVIGGAGLLVADTNLPRDTLNWLAEHCACPLFLSTISSYKAPRAQSMLAKVHTLAVSALEAQVLSGIRITGEDSLRQACRYFLRQGTQRVFLMGGRNGAFATDGSETVAMKGVTVRAENAMGTSGSFTAALALAWRSGFSLEQSVRAGTAAATICMKSRESVNHHLSLERLMQEMERLPRGESGVL